ncbi:hypothetical protein SD70_23700 [Gordoniibacillus kamchatkensis]|uniref:Uncharacterized protein n=1 Tax=Gordoniibacillus kamchatkensis TaxID=1590651 RepID=A0ABR5AD41_9BACL|nr:hypothetical protein [Paenibacillus sp. VKM B-2647]KIL38870.1 hypothetical protein SD70_23700 [Paenibacillus sp. VKM B-2647]
MKQILVFVLFASILCWLLFAPIYKHIVLIRQAVLQEEVDYLLEVGANASHGYVDAAAISESRQRLAARGFTPSLVEYVVDTTSGVNGSDPRAPVHRGTGIRLKITYPYERLFVIDRLVGMTPPDETSRMGAVGMKMSEYVP